MASPGVQQQPLVPFVPIRDCSQGVCSFYCPQWCYPIFPPPPPLGFFSDDSSSSNASLSPFIIALIGILASAFLVASYYIFVSRYCGGLGCFGRRSGGQDNFRGDPADDSEVLHGDRWQQPPPAAAGGLEEWIIRRIAVCRYKKGDGLVESGDCAVCLGEFRDGESLRLLPDCLHAFHVSCIDTWLKSHSSCPICRANIVYTFAPPSSTPNPPPRRTPTPQPRSALPVPEIRQDLEIAVQDRARGEEICGLENAGASVRKWRLRIYRESANLNGPNGTTEMPEEGIGQDAPRRSSGSNTDVLQQEVEGGLPTRGVYSVAEEVGSSRTFRMEQHACKGGGSDRVLHCIMSPAPTKRSFAGGRFCFPGQGKGNNEPILPL